MTALKDHKFLRHTHPKEVALRLRAIAQEKQESQESVSSQLLRAIETELVPPMVYALWTSSCPDESATVGGLQQSSSIIVRSSAIRSFRRKFRTSKCGRVWKALGGTEGILALLADFSVIHVKEFCKAVARCSTSKHARAERQELVTELLQALMPGPKRRTTDRRPLLDYYAKLAYTCTPEFQNTWMDQEDFPDLSREKAFAANPSVFQQKCLGAVKSCGGKLGTDFGQYSALLLSLPEEPHNKDTSVSESMAFTVQVLEAVQRHGVVLEHSLWLDKTLCSLLKRTAKRKASREFTLKALGVIEHCIQYQPDDDVFNFPRKWDGSYQRDSRRRQYWASLITLWTRDRMAYEPRLTSLLRAYGRLKSLRLSSLYPGDTEKAVHQAKRSDRYALLRWLILNLKRYDVDIEDGTKLEEIFPISEAVMLSLPRNDALSLLERYEKHSPGHLKLNISILERLGQHGNQLPIELIRLELVENPETSRLSVQSQIMHYQEMTVKTGSQPVRAAWLIVTFLFAMASRCSKTFQEVLIWARQYSRDPKTVMELYNDQIFSHGATLDRLSGIQGSLSSNRTMDNIKRDVQDGNRASLLLLESAVLAQVEPSYVEHHWVIVKSVFRRMIQTRLERVDAMQTRLCLTHEEVFTCVWDDTLNTLLRAEELGLSENNQDLGFGKSYGPLGHYDIFRLNLKTTSPATLRFIEELAKRRESLWLRHRPTLHPVVTTLQPPWPRGLPIQDLWFAKKQSRVPQGSLPFFEKRIRDVVFMPSEQALSPLPGDHDTRCAIEEFTDEYTLALRFYLTWCDAKEREKRLQAAWQHAIHHMSDQRLSAANIRDYWSRPFKEAGATPTKQMLNFSGDPIMPFQDYETTGPIEWNPIPDSGLANAENKKAALLAIDWYTRQQNVRFSYDNMDDESMIYKSSSEAIPCTNYWDVRRYTTRFPTKVKEAFIAAALLTVESRATGGSRILSRAFPTEEAIRFPALYLDADFIECAAPNDQCVNLIISQFLPAIPPTLLKDLAEGLLQKFQENTGSKNTLRKWIGVVLGALALSDKPQLATDLIVHVLIDAPDEATWHRVIFHAGMLRRLSSGQAASLLDRLRSKVLERLEWRSQLDLADEVNDKKTQNPGPYSASRSSTKVTVVKDLARTLQGAHFVGEQFTLDTLASLFSQATHIFIRAAVIISLSRLLFSSRSERIREGVLKALETLAVPIAAELNERDPMTEQRWRYCESVCEPPTMYRHDRLGPIFSALIGCLMKDAKRRGRFMHCLTERVLLPLIEKSRENNTRWTQIFFRKYLVHHLANTLPQGLAADNALITLLEMFTQHMPATEFKNYSDLVVAHSLPSKEIMDFTEDLRHDRLLRANDDARHWFEVRLRWDYHGTNICSLLLTARFADPDEAAARDLVMPAHLQDHERRLIDKLLADHSRFTKQWVSHMQRYAAPVRGTLVERARWMKYCKPLVQYAVSRADALRTSEWQRDPNRQPSILPDTFEYRLWLLDYYSLSNDMGRAERLERFAGQVIDIIQQLACSGRPYHDNFDKLQKAVESCGRREWAPVALHLGRLDGDLGNCENLALADLLRVQMSSTLLQGRAWFGQDDPRIQAVRDMAKAWMGCADEFVRVRGIETAKKFE